MEEDSTTQESGVVVMDNQELQKRKLEVAKEECYDNIKIWATKRTPGHCEGVWDGILCWGESGPSTIHAQPCPNYIHGFNIHENATRYCDANGSWFVHPETNASWTNFHGCMPSDNRTVNSISTPSHAMHEAREHRDRLQLIASIGYGVSLVSLVLAVFIICCSRKLKSKTNMLHLNLFLAFILRACLSFLIRLVFVDGLGLEKDVIKTDKGTYTFKEDGSLWECRMIYTIYLYGICVSQMWIFVEGLYLHMLIYKTLSTDRNGVKLYTIMGWALPIVILLPWVIVKYTEDNTYCWNYSSSHHYIWIIQGPMLATVMVNFIFFLNISRVLCSRVRSGDRHMGGAYRRLAKFILVLVPLFGVSYIVFTLVFPLSFVKRFNTLHMYVEMTYNSFQGFFLALLFCFLNEEVLNAVRSLWRRRTSKRDSGVTRSFVLSSFRRASRQSGRLSTTTNRYSHSSFTGEAPRQGWFARLKRRALSWIGGGKKSNSQPTNSYSSSSSRNKTGVDITNQNKMCYEEEEALKCISSFGDESVQVM